LKEKNKEQKSKSQRAMRVVFICGVNEICLI